jgi:hypothetical protein
LLSKNISGHYNVNLAAEGAFQIVAIPCFSWAVGTPAHGGRPGWCSHQPETNVNLAAERNENFLQFFIFLPHPPSAGTAPSLQPRGENIGTAKALFLFATLILATIIINLNLKFSLKNHIADLHVII